MVDYNQILTPGDVEGGMINVVVEIPVGSIQKIEWNRVSQKMEIDRQEPAPFPEPTNYGFIPQTIGGDGDQLDALIVSETVFPTGATLKSKIIGVMMFNDEGEVDDKVIVVPVENLSTGAVINSQIDLPQQKIDQITYYFNHYKDNKQPNSTVVEGWGDATEAKRIIGKSIECWKNQIGKSTS